jgi:hypothetical protein
VDEGKRRKRVVNMRATNMTKGVGQQRREVGVGQGMRRGRDVSMGVGCSDRMI